MRKLAPAGSTSKKAMALAVGYSEGVASSVISHIESTEGYANAMATLASETGNVALKALSVLKNRNLDKEDTRTILHAIEVLTRTWEAFTPKPEKDVEDKGLKPNRLRAIVIKTVEARDVTPTPTATP